MNAVVAAPPLEQLVPAAVARRNINESQWRTLKNLFPGAAPESIVLAWDYCVARRLDPMKKPCHIVPMEVKDAITEKYNWRDVVMPGIYEYRTTAQRTGQYLGHAVPTYGEWVDYKGVSAPEWCDFTVYRWNPLAQMKAEYPVRILFREIVATKRDGNPNARWSRSPHQMLTKCAEAAALREGFPDELGGTHTVEEMEGRVIDSTAIDVTNATAGTNPRGDTSAVDWEMRDKHVGAITDLLAEFGSDEALAAIKYREYVDEALRPFPELWITVDDKLAAEGIISKSTMKKYLKAEPANQRPDGR